MFPPPRALFSLSFSGCARVYILRVYSDVRKNMQLTPSKRFRWNEKRIVGDDDEEILCLSVGDVGVNIVISRARRVLEK